MAQFTNSGSFALRKLRRDLQGKGVNLRQHPLDPALFGSRTIRPALEKTA